MKLALSTLALAALVLATPASAAPDVSTWTGIWAGGGGPLNGGNNPVPRNEEWAKKQAARDAIMAKGQDIIPPNNYKLCIPNVTPAMMTETIQVVATPTVIMMVNNHGYFRTIWTDGRKHTPDDFLLDSFAGESIGTWEGNTLVVDTIGVREGAELAFSQYLGKVTHVVERWTMKDPNTLEIVQTISSPESLTRDYTRTINKRRLPAKETLEEVYCIPALDPYVNQKDGTIQFDLTPPDEKGEKYQ